MNVHSGNSTLFFIDIGSVQRGINTLYMFDKGYIVGRFFFFSLCHDRMELQTLKGLSKIC